MMNKMSFSIAVFILIALYGCVSVPSMYRKSPESVTDLFEPKIEVEDLRFYTAGQNGLEKKNRVYNNVFREGSVSWMWYELTVRNLSDSDTKLLFREMWTDENNAVLSSIKKEMSVRKKDVYLEYSAGISAEWKPGYYVLKLYQDSLKIAEKEFKITKIK